MCCYARGARIEQKIGSSPDHGQAMMLAMDLGEK